jgi:hypothetical protein
MPLIIGQCTRIPSSGGARRCGQLAQGRLGGFLGVGWPLTVVVAVALQPTPAEPEAAPALTADLGWRAALAALATTVVLAADRQRAAALSAVVGGLIATTFSVTCPLSAARS